MSHVKWKKILENSYYQFSGWSDKDSAGQVGARHISLSLEAVINRIRGDWIIKRDRQEKPLWQMGEINGEMEAKLGESAGHLG